MPWYAWTLIAAYALSTVLHIAWIGKPRDTYTPLSASVALVVNGLCVWAIVVLAEAA